MKSFVPLLSVILLIAVLFSIYYFWIPQYQKSAILDLQLQKKRETIKENESYLKEINDELTSLSQYKDELAKIDGALPTDVSMPSLFNFSQYITAENGLTLVGISYGAISIARSETEEVGIKKIPFSLTVEGNYNSFKNFLGAVYRNSRVIEVEAISFSSPQSGVGKSNLAAGEDFVFNINLAAYAI